MPFALISARQPTRVELSASLIDDEFAFQCKIIKYGDAIGIGILVGAFEPRPRAVLRESLSSASTRRAVGWSRAPSGSRANEWMCDGDLAPGPCSCLRSRFPFWLSPLVMSAAQVEAWSANHILHPSKSHTSAISDRRAPDATSPSVQLISMLWLFFVRGSFLCLRLETRSLWTRAHFLPALV